MFAVGAAVAFYHNGFGAELSRHFHGHGRMDSEQTCFVAARSHHATVGNATNKHRFAIQSTVKQALAGDEKGVEIYVDDGFQFQVIGFSE